MIDRHLHTNCELAGKVGTAPEALSRAIRCLRQQGLIKVSRWSIEILQIDGLNRQAEVLLD